MGTTGTHGHDTVINLDLNHCQLNSRPGPQSQKIGPLFQSMALDQGRQEASLSGTLDNDHAWTRDYAQSLDQQDYLARFREEFHIPSHRHLQRERASDCKTMRTLDHHVSGMLSSQRKRYRMSKPLNRPIDADHRAN